MREISLNILDVALNSVKAHAKSVLVKVIAEGNTVKTVIKDDGEGMDEKFLMRVSDPFTTTVSGKKVGMGLSLMKMAAELTGGSFHVSSEKGKGTVVEAEFIRGSVDRMPIGDLTSTMTSLIASAPNVDWRFYYRIDGREFDFELAEFKNYLNGIPIERANVIACIGEYLSENIKTVNGGVIL